METINNDEMIHTIKVSTCAEFHIHGAHVECIAAWLQTYRGVNVTIITDVNGEADTIELR